MISERIHLKEYYPKLQNDVILDVYCPDNNKEVDLERTRKTMLVLPGGGYEFCSAREAEPVALQFLSADMNAFVLYYSLKEQITYGYPLLDVYAALSFIRKNAVKYHVQVDSISVIGFSAGGHLAGISSCYCQRQEFADMLGITLPEMKINGAVLCYAVMVKEYAHQGTFNWVSQGKDELKDFFAIDQHITDDYPPTFLWHTAEDGLVPVQNSILVAKQLADHKIPFELHIYPDGGHGLSLINRSVFSDKTPDEFIQKLSYEQSWMKDCIRFIKEHV